MANLTLLCRPATTFTASKALDESAFHDYLQRFVDAGVGVYVASGGTGEGASLSHDELRRVYEISVETCKGKVPVNANPPEGHSAQVTIEHVKLAAAMGIEVVNVYGPTPSHGYRPTEGELRAYFEEVLSACDNQIALAPNPVMGYSPSPSLIADLCNRYHQVVAVNFSGLGEPYFIQLKDALKREVETYVSVPGSMQMLLLGATGLIDAHANILPKTHKRYADLCGSGNDEALTAVYSDILHWIRYCATFGSVRSIKMAMRALKLPGGEGGVRPPYLMPSEEDYARFTAGLLKLGIPEIDDLARAAGLT